ncbi:MAG: hypothetical protein JEY94_15510 [Melioribacteraceae bacterium]|nr:hypothetical protein [Melioribacteraceae bacterium]
MRLKRVEDGADVYYINVETGERVEKDTLILNNANTKSIDDSSDLSKLINTVGISIFAAAIFLALILFAVYQNIFNSLILAAMGLFVMILLYAASWFTKLVKKGVESAEKYVD